METAHHWALEARETRICNERRLPGRLRPPDQRNSISNRSVRQPEGPANTTPNRKEIFRRVALEKLEIRTETGVVRMNHCEALFFALSAMALQRRPEGVGVLQRLRKLCPAAEAEPDVMTTVPVLWASFGN